MYIATLKIEFFSDIMGELTHDFEAADVLTDALNIFLSIFTPDGAYRFEFREQEDITRFCIEQQAKLEECPVEYIDENYSSIIDMLVSAFLDNICGFFGHPPTHPMNTDSFIGILGLYYSYDQSISVMWHHYTPHTTLLRLCVW